MGIITVLLIQTFMCTVSAASINITNYESVAYCSPYCDIYGYYQPGKWCVNSDSSQDVYCCGSEHDRFCCGDESKNVGETYPPVDKCPKSSWWHYQWRVLIGLIGTVIALLMLSACCYFCCGGSNSGGRSSRLRQSRLWQAASGNSRTDTPPTGDTFDPQSPYAFIPPDYDSLPKDPPKYAEIFGADGNNQSTGITNPGYEACNETNEEAKRNRGNNSQEIPASNPQSATQEGHQQTVTERRISNSNSATDANSSTSETTVSTTTSISQLPSYAESSHIDGSSDNTQVATVTIENENIDQQSNISDRIVHNNNNESRSVNDEQNTCNCRKISSTQRLDVQPTSVEADTNDTADDAQSSRNVPNIIPVSENTCHL